MINLEKGQHISLKKSNNNENLKNISIGLGWDVNNFTNADLDAFVLQMDKSNNIIDKIYYNNLISDDKAIKHMGDNLTGRGNGDDETININLNQLDVNTHKLIFAVNIYNCTLTFERVKNAYVRVVNKENTQQLIRYDLTKCCGDNYCITIAELTKNENGDWVFEAKGIASKCKSIKSFCSDLKNQETLSCNANSNVQTDHQSQHQRKGFISRLFGK